MAALAARRAEALIVASAGDPISVGDLARAVGVSVRTLCRGFQHLRGYGPTEAVRRARLLRVRHDLLTAGDRDRVTDVAMRWGFCHLGRFSGVYAAHFGELPSETRRRSMACARQGANPQVVRA
jgi:transcriptional regulator GlxA family with amidase domain